MSPDLSLTPSDRRSFNWRVFFLVLACSAITAGIVRFSENLHYSNSLLQANDQTNSAQTQLAAEQRDVKFIISHDNSQLNCYEMQSSYDRNLCNLHNQ
jgi:hypothetical protein